MKILWVATRIPWPADDGPRVLTSATLRGLAPHAEVLVVGPGSDAEANEASKALGVRVRGVRPVGRGEKGLRAAWQLARGRSPSLAAFTGRLTRACIDEARAFRPDVVVADGLHVGLAAEAAAAAVGVRWVLRAHNGETLLAQRCAASLTGPARWIAAATVPLLGRLERNLASRAACVCVLSVDDGAATLGQSGGRARVELVPASYEPAHFVAPPPEGDPIAVFVGDLAWAPNVDAIEWLVRSIWPRIRRANPAARLRIVGKRPGPGLFALAEANAGDGVELVGPVKSVTPELAAARVAVVPLRAGSGIRLKILEAFAHERQVVSTTLGAEGLPGLGAAPIVLADTEEAFAAAVLRGLATATSAPSGRAWISRHAGVDAMGRRLLAVLAEASQPVPPDCVSVAAFA